MPRVHPSVGAGTMEPPRRSFFYKAITLLMGVLLPLPAVVAGLASLVNPLRPDWKKKQLPSGSETLNDVPGFFKTLSTDTLSTDPQLVQIIADRKDAWNTYPKAPIGAAYLQKTSDRKLKFETEDWAAETSLKAAVDAAAKADKEAVFRELLEVEFSLLRREKERGGHEWTTADTSALVNKYKQLFPDRAAVVDAVGQAARWEGGVRVFNVYCPHAGCAVDFRKLGAEPAAYHCPCHNSKFAADGTRDLKSPSARDLDGLDYAIQKGVILIRYQNFKAGEAAKHAT